MPTELRRRQAVFGLLAVCVSTAGFAPRTRYRAPMRPPPSDSRDVAVDPSLPVEDAHVTSGATFLGLGRTLGLAGRCADIGVGMPLVFGHLGGRLAGHLETRSSTSKGPRTLTGRRGWLRVPDSASLRAVPSFPLNSDDVRAWPCTLLRERHITAPRRHAERKKFEAIVGLFQKYGAQYDMDYLLLAAQGRQESTLDQNIKSPVGALGVMQVMPATGKELNVGDISRIEPMTEAVS